MEWLQSGLSIRETGTATPQGVTLLKFKHWWLLGADHKHFNGHPSPRRWKEPLPRGQKWLKCMIHVKWPDKQISSRLSTHLGRQLAQSELSATNVLFASRGVLKSVAQKPRIVFIILSLWVVLNILSSVALDCLEGRRLCHQLKCQLFYYYFLKLWGNASIAYRVFWVKWDTKIIRLVEYFCLYFRWMVLAGIFSK